jgi:hypothetical protein
LQQLIVEGHQQGTYNNESGPFGRLILKCLRNGTVRPVYGNGVALVNAFLN